jgi:3-dehydroquinate dehydratase II
MKILVINGPNLNMVGSREPHIYGHETLDQVNARVTERAEALGVDVAFFQSNHEGALIDRLQQCDFDGVIINPGGLTHSSVALRDAMLSVSRPFVEVHLSDPMKREPFRHVNFLRDVALASVVGQGPAGYVVALERLVGSLSGSAPEV